MFFSNNKQDKKKKNLFYFPLEITLKKKKFTERLGNIFLRDSSNAYSNTSPTHIHLVMCKILLHSVLDQMFSKVP